MRFWDTSALVPLFLHEAQTPTLRALRAADPDVVAWWGTETECMSVIARLVRVGQLTGETEAAARDGALALLADALEVAPSDDVRSQAALLLRRHPLRAADALQLGAAMVWAEGRPGGPELVSLDARLRDAAGREGFTILP